MEEELVAISRGREVANVYAVASSELLDADLGPATRELSDELHDIRAAMEREGADYPAAEVRLRREIEALGEGELARRRKELVATSSADVDPTQRRRERMERQIANAEQTLEMLRGERAALEEMTRPPARELARVRAAEATSAEGLERLRSQLTRLPDAVPAGEPRPLDPARRLEAALVEKRIEQLARRAVAEARLDRSNLLYEALGPYPGEPVRALAWGQAAHAISTYRLRHGVFGRSNVLGREPRDAVARAERARVRQTLEVAQRRLGIEAERSLSRSLSIER
jgi:hypothetical protein